LKSCVEEQQKKKENKRILHEKNLFKLLFTIEWVGNVIASMQIQLNRQKKKFTNMITKGGNLYS